MRLIIKNACIPHKDGREEIKSIAVEDGKIVEISEKIENGDSFVDAEGNFVLPGLIDMDCNICDPGYENKEDILSVSKAAARGGFTSITCQPNTLPVIDNKTVVNYIISKSKKQASTNIYVYGSMTRGMECREMAEIGEMVNAGIVGLSDGGISIPNAFLMRNILTYSKMFGIPVIAMCQDNDIARDGVANSGRISTAYGLKGIPKEAEETYVARNIILAEHTRARLHISSVTTKGSVELIRMAKKKGINITCETKPHYFTLTDESIKGYNTFAKVSPPLRSKEDVEAIKEGLLDDTIDVISTGHSPDTIESKDTEFDLASFGISSLETAFSISYDALVSKGLMTMGHLCEKFCKNPAEILKINGKGRIKEGYDGDIIIFNKNKSYYILPEKFVSKAKYSPYSGSEICGKLVYTIVKGEIVYSS